MAWAIQRGTVAIPKSADLGRMQENIAVGRSSLFERTTSDLVQLIQLTPEEMSVIDNIHKKPGMHRSLLAYHPPNGIIFGWTYEQLGWPMTTGGVVV